MKKNYLLTLLLILVFSCVCKSQTKNEESIDMAYQNAKKGIYWVLQNIPEKKRLNSDLIADDKLYASVRFEKEINGIEIESTGYYLSYSVKINIYKSYNNLVKEGYLKEIPSE